MVPQKFAIPGSESELADKSDVLKLLGMAATHAEHLRHIQEDILSMKKDHLDLSQRITTIERIMYMGIGIFGFVSTLWNAYLSFKR